MAGIYIHVPFCKQACSYCDFYFVTREEDKKAYIRALLFEIESYTDTPESQEPVQTVYFGGGTPSRLSPGEVGQIMKALREVFDMQATEVTLEMNPDDVSRDYLRDLHNEGINRSSMGIQSFDPELLQFMHRAHNREEAISSLELLSTSPIQNFTVDLIYGNPGQTTKQVEHDLQTLLSYDPPHLSAYSLTIESGTRLGKQFELNRLIPADDELVGEQADLIRNRCAGRGIVQYEVSNFARPGSQAQHNTAYWHHENYLGMGPGAHSFWWTPDKTKAVRRSNKRDLKAYLSTHRSEMRDEREELDLSVLAEERIMLGLRTKAGVSLEELSKRYGYKLDASRLKFVEDQIHIGFMVDAPGHLILTDAGLNVADRITLDLLTAHG